MTRRSIFQEPKIVLVFNSHRVLVAMHKSLNLASQAMKIPAQSISLCCLGHHISCYGYYFRHYEHTQVDIAPLEDFGTLRVDEYDQMCNQVSNDPAPRVFRTPHSEKSSYVQGAGTKRYGTPRIRPTFR